MDTHTLADTRSAATAAVLERFNRAFLEHDPSLLPARRSA
jgi:hypothetical protein